MSDRRSTWVDYANLGANIIQVGQLSGVRQRLNELARIETDREERIQLENELRQFIFEIEGGIEHLTEYLQKAPLGVYITIFLLEELFDEVGVEPATFQQFADKDRVKKVRSASSSIMEEAANELSGEEVKEVSFRLKLFARFSDIDLLVSHLKASQELPEIEKRWKELSAETYKNRYPFVWALIIGILLLAGSCISSANGFMHLSSANGLLFFGGEVAVILGIIGLLATGARLGELTQEKEKLRKKILSSEKLQELYEVFGEDLTISQYERIEEETRAYVTQATEMDKDGNSLPKSLFELTFPPQMFEQENSLETAEDIGEKWKCPNCGGGNPGNRTTCLGCNTERGR